MPIAARRQGGKGYAAIWSYPWDLLAEGLDESLGRIADAGLSAISLAVSYHSGMLLLPHNPKQKVRFLEDGAIYFRPHSGHFAGLAVQPRVSDLATWRDPLADICEAAARHGLAVDAWTVCCHNSFQGEQHPNLSTANVFGDPYPFALCPAQDDVQAYLSALLAELGDYPLRVLQLESYTYMGFYHGHHHEKILLNLGPISSYLLGLCFCDACQRSAENENVDFDQVRQDTRRYLEKALEGRLREPNTFSNEPLLEAVPSLAPYLTMRENITTRMVQRLSRAGKPLALLGVTPDVLAQARDSIAEVHGSAYHLTPEEVTASVRKARTLVGDDMSLGIGIEANPHMSPTEENLVAKIRAAWEAGADRLYFYNYGLMPLQSLAWIKTGLS